MQKHKKGSKKHKKESKRDRQEPMSSEDEEEERLRLAAGGEGVGLVVLPAVNLNYGISSSVCRDMPNFCSCSHPHGPQLQRVRGRRMYLRRGLLPLTTTEGTGGEHRWLGVGDSGPDWKARNTCAGGVMKKMRTLTGGRYAESLLPLWTGTLSLAVDYVRGGTGKEAGAVPCHPEDGESTVRRHLKIHTMVVGQGWCTPSLAQMVGMAAFPTLGAVAGGGERDSPLDAAVAILIPPTIVGMAGMVARAVMALGRCPRLKPTEATKSGAAAAVTTTTAI